MSRITIEEAKKLGIKVKPQKTIEERLPDIAVYEVRRDLRRKSKYGAEVTEIDDIDFASKGESLRYNELKLLEKAGEISDLSIQPEFLLQEGFEYNKKKYTRIKYTADFKYLKEGNTKYTIEEFKGSRFQATKDKSYSLRKRMFLYKYGCEYDFIEKIGK